MKIQKAKLVKGTFLEVSFSDGIAIVNKSFPSTEAPPKIIKAFMALNHHLADLTEQYDATGRIDYDNIVVRGYHLKGDDEKEGLVLTGLRTLKTGKVIGINSPFMSIDVTESTYPNCKSLIDCLENCRIVVTTYLNNNKSQEEAQLKIFGAKDENVILKSQKPGEAQTAVDVVFADEIANIAANTKVLTEQEQMDQEMPLHQDQLKKSGKKKTKDLPTLDEFRDQAKKEGLSISELADKTDAARLNELKDILTTRTLTNEEQGEMMKLNADKNRKRSHKKK